MLHVLPNSKVHFHMKWVYYISLCNPCKIFTLQVGPSHTYIFIVWAWPASQFDFDRLAMSRLTYPYIKKDWSSVQDKVWVM